MDNKRNYNIRRHNKSKALNLGLVFHMILFFVGWLGFESITFVFQIIFLPFVNPEDVKYLALVFFNSYVVLFLAFILMIVLTKFRRTILYQLSDWKPYLIGIGIGIGLIVVSMLYGLLVGLIYPVEDSDNQKNVVQLITGYPVLSVIIVGIVAPICEELTYRLGLFSLCNRRSRLLAYILTSIIFGMIHFSWTGDLINELLNLPSYLMAGLILSFAYDYFGLPASIMAHITNNLYSTFAIIILGK